MTDYLLKLVPVEPFQLVYDNDIDSFIPELWANEALLILENNMVAANLVYRDFEPYVANFGDTVHTRRFGAINPKRKVYADNVVVQDVSAADVAILLNQHIHTSFLIRDGEESKAFQDLVNAFLKPAMIGQANFIDQMILGQYPFFLGNSYGTLGALDSTNAKVNILGTRQVMNQNKAPLQGRAMVLNPASEAAILSLDLFLGALNVGDQGQALKEAALGRKLSFDMYMDQNMSSVPAVSTATSDTTSAAYPAGTTSMVLVSVVTYTAGEWVTVAGDMTPLQVVSYTAGTKTLVVAAPGLKHAVASGAAVKGYTPGAVNLSGGYALGYAKEITVSGFSVAPQIGQFVTFAASTTPYTIMAVNGLVGITLDRPLDAAINNSDAVNLGPPGNYNLAFVPNAIALVVRPLAKPKAGTGALSAVANYNGLSIRTTITYDGNKQGHLVTLDMLAGIKVLDTNLGAVLLG